MASSASTLREKRLEKKGKKKGKKSKEKNAFFFFRKSVTIASFVLVSCYLCYFSSSFKKKDIASTCHIDISGCPSPVICHVSLSISEKKIPDGD